MADDAASTAELTEPSETTNAAVPSATPGSADRMDRAGVEDRVDVEDRCDEEAPDATTRARHRPWVPHWPPRRWAGTVMVAAIVALAALAGWLGLSSYHDQQARQHDEVFLRVARQAAVNLTTIDWRHAEGDVQRILDSAEGTFHDDFSGRAPAFVDAVKQSQSTTVGSVVDAGLESRAGDDAQVLVAVTVTAANAAAPRQDPRGWRMRISVHRGADANAKITNVEFVP